MAINMTPAVYKCNNTSQTYRPKVQVPHMYDPLGMADNSGIEIPQSEGFHWG